MQKDHVAGGSSQRKRLRQTSLDQLFGFNKKQKQDKLDKQGRQYFTLLTTIAVCYFS